LEIGNRKSEIRNPKSQINHNFSNQKYQMVNWGIIGVGDVCERKSGPAFNKVEGSCLKAVMRRTGHLAENYAKRHGVPKWYDNAEALINDPEINAIYIATPPDGHSYYTALAAAAGKPVYVEKPMARNHQECLDMIAACEQAGVPLFVAFYRRALPNFLKVKSLIEEGAIGDVRFVDVKVHKSLYPDIVGQSENANNWRTQPDVAGAGYFYDLASHQLDLLDFIFGPIVKAQGFAKNFGGIYAAEDTTLGTFVFESGVLGMGSWCFASAQDTALEMTTIYGSKGSISFPFFTDFNVILKVDGETTQEFTFDMPENIQLPLITSIVEELNGVGKSPSNGVSGARTNWVMGAICSRVDK
jgi:predicted dehydrogenase